MTVYLHSLLRNTLCPLFMLLPLLSLPATAQQKTLDYNGEVDDAGHAEGYRDFVENGCWQCHGFQGQGMAGPSLAPNPLPYEAFSALVRKPANVMPAFSPNVLSEEKLKRIHLYLQSIPQAPNPDSIPILSTKK